MTLGLLMTTLGMRRRSSPASRRSCALSPVCRSCLAEQCCGVAVRASTSTGQVYKQIESAHSTKWLSRKQQILSTCCCCIQSAGPKAKGQTLLIKTIYLLSWDLVGVSRQTYGSMTLCRQTIFPLYMQSVGRALHVLASHKVTKSATVRCS